MNEPAWYRQSRDRSERFARAIERGATHHDDAEFGAELAVVSALRSLSAEPTVDADARARMRERLLAGERAADAGSAGPSPAPVPLRHARRRRTHANWIAGATAAGFLGFGMLGIQMSQSALPGDFLYDVKRTTEALSLDLTFADGARAFKQLELASTRVGELEALVARHDERGDGSFAEPAVYLSVLNDLDTAASLGSQSVTALASRGDGAAVQALQGWAADQVERMNAIKAGMPSAVVGRFEVSVDLLQQIQRRATALSGRMDCYQITSGMVDDLGAVPAEAACESRPASYDLRELYDKDFRLPGAAPATDPAEEADAVTPVPEAPVVEPTPTPADDPGLPSADVSTVEPPEDVDDGLQRGDPRVTEKLTLAPPAVPTSASMFPGLPTADLP